MKLVFTTTWLSLLALLMHGRSQNFDSCYSQSSDGTNTSRACYNGRCDDGNCVCDPGWSGSNCNMCAGRILLEGESGIIVDGNGKYSKDKECSWVIQPKRKGSYKIRLRLDEFVTECGWDYLYIYDGDSAFAPLLASFNGIIARAKNDSSYRPEVVASSGKAFLHFFSDMEFVMDGFRISYSLNGCPQNCSRNGLCNYENATCSCDDGWTGEACEARLCHKNCLTGDRCYNSDDDSFIDCECAEEDTCVANSNSSVGHWKHVNYLDVTTAHGRASHAGVVVEDSMWFYGGIQFNDHPFSYGFEVYNMTSSSWNHVVSNSTPPSLRYGHSMVLHKNIIYVFGGRDVWTSDASDELWTFNPFTLAWKQISYSVDSGAMLPSNSSVLALWGHTANTVELEDGLNVMIVMFGFHTEYELSGFVFEYNFDTAIWTKVITSGDRMEGSFGHTSTWDPVNRLCYLHGGFSYHQGKTKFVNTDVTFSYQPDTKFFKILRPSGAPRFLHSSALMHGMLMVYGGCAHVDNDANTDSSCFSPSLMAYDPSHNTWKVLEENTYVNSGRYGHVALAYSQEISGGSDEMLIFGGYNGETMNDLLVFQPYSCDAYSASKDLCTKNPSGLTCVWNGSTCIGNSTSTKSSADGDSKSSNCEGINQCSSCKSSSLQCRWCGGKCKDLADCEKDETCTDFVKTYCKAFRSCQQCEYNSECQWQQRGVCEDRKNNQSVSCPDACGVQMTCDSCFSKQSCMWCSNKQLCFSTMSYVVQFPYGECMEWINKRDRCPGKDMCDHHKTCSTCMSDPYCGWCDGGKNNGLGKCHIGSLTGVDNVNSTQNVLSYGIVPSQNNASCQPGDWHFTTCPICQCNGHSTCHNGTSECISCQNHTTGNQCERCIPGYFGPAMNGGECKPCQCLGRAESCDPESGRCYCSTKGMTGDQCERCDVNSKYVGDPSTNGTCYYKLLMNFSFTFTLSKRVDEFVTAINFMNTPDEYIFTEINFKSQEHCDVIVNVVALKLTLVDNGNGSMIENYKEEETNVVSFTAITNINSYGLGIPEANETFRIYVSNFTVPEQIVISLVQKTTNYSYCFSLYFPAFLSSYWLRRECGN